MLSAYKSRCDNLYAVFISIFIYARDKIAHFSDYIRLETGIHACAIYETDEEHRETTAAILKDGIKSNHKILYISDANHPVAVVSALADAKMDTKHYIRNGQFAITTSADAKMRGQDFNPDGIIKFFREALNAAVKEGYAALRIISEMTCVMLGPPGPARLSAYEEVMGRLISEGRCIAVCMFDRRRFLPELLNEALKIHKYAILGSKLYNNICYIPPEERIFNNTPLAELNRCIKMILRCNNAKPKGGRGVI